MCFEAISWQPVAVHVLYQRSMDVWLITQHRPTHYFFLLSLVDCHFQLFMAFQVTHQLVDAALHHLQVSMSTFSLRFCSKYQASWLDQPSIFFLNTAQKIMLSSWNCFALVWKCAFRIELFLTAQLYRSSLLRLSFFLSPIFDEMKFAWAETSFSKFSNVTLLSDSEFVLFQMLII